MNRIIRSVASVFGATVMAAGVLATGTTAGQATTNSTAQDCLNTFVQTRFAVAGPEGVTFPPFNQPMTPFFHLRDVPSCDGITASIAISRRDGSDVRNQVARISRVNGLITAFNYVQPWWKDAGTWAIRQIAVKKNGVTVVRGFDPATSPTIQVRRASIIHGRPLGGYTRDLVTDQHGYLTIQGYLSAWGSDGKKHPLAAGQRVLIQVRERGTTKPYQTLAIATTSASGYYRKTAYFDYGRPQDLRVAYLTPYQTIASHFSWVGVARNL
jgi:hypothetical protein